jgi:CDP-glycerol glycerophosphotransferase (TagB/SpsB family)
MKLLRSSLINVTWLLGWSARPLVVILERIVPLDYGLIIIGARNGLYFMDNSRYLFEWLREHRPERRVVWLTWKRSIARSLRDAGHECLWMPTPAALLVMLRAEVAIYCNRLLDVCAHPAFLRSDTRLVYLSHGVGVKAKRMTRKDSLSWPLKNELDVARRRLVITTSASEFMAMLCSRSQGLSLSHYRLTGYPRNDMLFREHPESAGKWAVVTGDRIYKRTILYAPTWRQGGSARFFPFHDFSADTLRRWLQETNTLLFIRPHIKDMKGDSFKDETAEALIESCEGNVRPLHAQVCPDCYLIMNRIDVLVTDYSSIYHDFLLLDRPILFVPYDYDEYLESNGFQYDYWKHLPGPAINSFRQFINAVDDIDTGDNSFRELRRVLRQRLHDFQDGDSSSRISNLIESELLGRSQTEDKQ